MLLIMLFILILLLVILIIIHTTSGPALLQPSPRAFAKGRSEGAPGRPQGRNLRARSCLYIDRWIGRCVYISNIYMYIIYIYIYIFI